MYVLCAFVILNKDYLLTYLLTYNTRPRNEVGLFYNAPEPTRGVCSDKLHLYYACNAAEYHNNV